MSGKYALIIGNTDYIDQGLAQLTAPGKDAEDFARVLKDPNICAFDDVMVLFNELSATVIEKIDEFFDQKKPDDMLILYFSGHGVRDEGGSLYLAFKNTVRSRLRSTAVKADYIKEAMDQSRSKRQVLILDCCNSGAFPQGTKAEVGGTMGLTQAFQGYGRFVLTASDATQFAWEGDKVIGSTDNSLFTHFLLKGLEGEADQDGDGNITVDELYDYAYEQVSKVTPKQTPTKSASKVAGDIILRQITRMEDIKPVALPDDLISEMEDLRPYVREAAVQKLERILKGKNIGMARSAAEALEKIAADDNTTRRVAETAKQALESFNQKIQKLGVEDKSAYPATSNSTKNPIQEVAKNEVGVQVVATQLKTEPVATVLSEKTAKTQTTRVRTSVLACSALGIFVSIIAISIWGILSIVNKPALPSKTEPSPTKQPLVVPDPQGGITESPTITPLTNTTTPTVDSIKITLKLCKDSSEDICVYSFAPQPSNLIIALIFEQNLDATALPQLTVENQKFECEILFSYPDRLYCHGPAIAGDAEIVIASPTNEIIASGSFRIPKYVVPSPTPKNPSGKHYP